MGNITALFPGSFDPFTSGHYSIVTSALPMFDKIYIAIGNNAQKKSLFTLEDRLKWIRKVYAAEPKIEVVAFAGLTVDFAKQCGAKIILRGLRSAMDFEYELAIAQNNKILNPAIDSVFLLTPPQFSHINSTIVRDIVIHGGNCKPFLPEAIYEEIIKLKLDK